MVCANHKLGRSTHGRLSLEEIYEILLPPGIPFWKCHKRRFVMSDKEGEEINVGIGSEIKVSCTLISMEKVGLQYWKATVRCPDGTIKSATSANKNQSKALACLECD